MSAIGYNKTNCAKPGCANDALCSNPRFGLSQFCNVHSPICSKAGCTATVTPSKKYGYFQTCYRHSMMAKGIYVNASKTGHDEQVVPLSLDDAPECAIEGCTKPTRVNKIDATKFTQNCDDCSARMKPLWDLLNAIRTLERIKVTMEGADLSLCEDKVMAALSKLDTANDNLQTFRNTGEPPVKKARNA